MVSVVSSQHLWCSILGKLNTQRHTHAKNCLRISSLYCDSWFDTNPDKMRAYFALFLTMPQMKTKEVKINCLKRATTATPICGKKFHMLRFPPFLHFVENTTANKSNMLMAVRNAAQYIHLHTEFKTFYDPQDNVAISLTKLKWQLSLFIYNPSKCKKICIWHESTR